MDSFPSFDTLLVSIEAELVSTRSQFVVALQYFRGHGRVNAASVHESAMEETREQKEMKRTDCASSEVEGATVVRGGIELVIFFMSALAYIRRASRRGVQRNGLISTAAPRSTDMSLMYGKEKDDETGTVLMFFFYTSRLIK